MSDALDRGFVDGLVDLYSSGLLVLMFLMILSTCERSARPEKAIIWLRSLSSISSSVEASSSSSGLTTYDEGRKLAS